MNAGNEPDPVLVVRSLSGDQSAFTALARRHGPRLARTAKALGVTPDEVEDVVQQALVSAWRALAEYDLSKPFVAWVTVITANKARDWRRHKRSKRWWSEGPAFDQDEVLNVEDPLAGAETLELRAQLRQVSIALQGLPDKFRIPLVMVTVTGLSQREAGAALGITEKAVEIRVRRARQLLAERLQGRQIAGAL
ncbi:MAG: hypothetical protein B7Y99_00305 [Caulobacterales bacterium 32-69-10]|nr:MAG: hypothetical protein B7Y99_00305 [Caulobacterales bacterium 32-69-10]